MMFTNFEEDPTCGKVFTSILERLEYYLGPYATNKTLNLSKAEIEHWLKQLTAARDKWLNKDYDGARSIFLHLAYAAHKEGPDSWLKDSYEWIVRTFIKEDPLYKEILEKISPFIDAHPGILQSEVSKHFQEYDAEVIRYVLYYAEKTFTIIREKSGRSYALKLYKTPEQILYEEYLPKVLPIIEKNPQIIQSHLAKQFPELEPNDFRCVLYYAAKNGKVIREKKGRSYLLSLPKT